MFRSTKPPPFVPSNPNAPKWMIANEKKKFLSEWKSEQRARWQLLNKGLPVPPISEKFQLPTRVENAEYTGYPQLGPDTSAFLHKTNYQTIGSGAMDDSDEERDQNVDPRDKGFRIMQKLKSDVNKLRVKPYMPYDFVTERINEFIKCPRQLALLTNDTIKLYVAVSKIHEGGLGLFTATPIPSRTPVVEYFGHVKTIETACFNTTKELDAPYGYIHDGVLMYPDMVNKEYFAVFPAANRDTVCAAYFANYHKEPNLEMCRAYVTERASVFYGVRKRFRKDNGGAEHPRFFLFSGEHEIPEHTELCWNYGITDPLELDRQGLRQTSNDAKMASQTNISIYNEFYERNSIKYAKKQNEIIVAMQRDREEAQRMYEEQESYY